MQLAFERRSSRTVLAQCSHRGPLRVQKALYPEGDAVCHAIVLHPPAGIAGGDSLEIDVKVDAGAHALLTTPGAGKWYRSAGSSARLTQRITVADDGVCEWLPQESIVFNGALGALETVVELHGNACFIGAEMLCFGRTGSGEHFTRGKLGISTRISRDGRPLWLERGRIAGASPLVGSSIRISRRGSITARATDSICFCPPDRLPAGIAQNVFSGGNREKIQSSRPDSIGPSEAARTMFSRTVRSVNMRMFFGT